MPDVEFGVLGPIEVRVGGCPVAVHGARQRAVLTSLLLRRGTVVSLDRLVDDVFGEQPPDDARNAVQTYVARLRKALGPAARYVVTRPPGYLLDVPDDAVDALRFEALCVNDSAALADVDAALALWRGPAYGEFADDLARGHAQRLEELRLVAIEHRAELLLDRDRTSEAVSSLEALLDEEPWRERAVTLLVTALARQGRTADALAVYRTYRDRIRDDLGLDPPSELQMLERQVLTRELSFAPKQEQRSRLPTRTTSFLGRDDELDAVAAALAPGTVVTLTGPGGVGKTRIAAELAKTEGHVWWVDLAALHDDTALHRTVVDAIGLDVRPGDTGVDALRGWLRTADGLLVLDNCEHLLVGTSSLVEDALAVPSGVRLLATSRQPIGVGAEHVLVVGPLRLPETGEPKDAAPAVQLFLDRARTVDGSARPRLLRRIVDICRALDGLPLAIELAAARVGTLTVDDLADRLDARFELLRGARGQARHNTLEGVVDWSYELLTEAEQLVFLRLSVFRSEFDLAAAEAVVADADLPVSRVADLVARLADRSMLTRPGTSGVGKYRMLETLRHYAASRLPERARDELRRRHAEFLTDFAERAEIGLSSDDEGAWARAVEGWLSDLRAAWRWASEARPDLAVRLTAALMWFGYWRLRADVLAWGEWAVREMPSHPRLPEAYTAAAHAAWFGGRLERGRELARRGIDVAGGGEAPAAAAALNALGDIELLSGALDEALPAYEAYAVVSERAGDAVGYALGRANTALSLAYGGDPRAADVAADAVAAAYRAANPTSVAFALFAQGEALADDDPDRASAALAEARSVAADVGNPFVSGVALTASLALSGRRGEPAEALALFRQAVEHWQRTGNRTLIVTTLRNLVILLARTGRDVHAVELAAALERTAHARTYGTEAQRIETALAAVRQRLGDDVYARAWASGARRSLDAAAEHAAAILRAE
ncbi:AfsR/SARP family transcriptional regulator [Haloechinothrix salitolerans]|uniref:BTAD domain-containing putative transcriptional regulator n=1 Tax=Haloechinothrix salitolerans TaxID=926830 RepID=A0ABW2BVR9_9PSEU